MYLMTGIEMHPDKGFGITADAYYKSAKHLMNNHFEDYNVTPQAEMPQNFLFRHAIELYLKSLIIIFHRKLKIEYGSVPYNSEEPEVLAEGKWRKLYSCHFIDKLYDYWLNNLLLPCIEQLKKAAPSADWQENKGISDLISVVCKYDQDSSYFRYPITKSNNLDHKKYTMQKFKASKLGEFINEIQETKNESKNGTFTMLVVDEEDNITKAFKNNENVLSDVRDALDKIAFYFNCIHIMTRVTLCDSH